MSQRALLIGNAQFTTYAAARATKHMPYLATPIALGLLPKSVKSDVTTNLEIVVLHMINIVTILKSNTPAGENACRKSRHPSLLVPSQKRQKWRYDQLASVLRHQNWDIGAGTLGLGIGTTWSYDIGSGTSEL